MSFEGQAIYYTNQQLVSDNNNFNNQHIAGMEEDVQEEMMPLDQAKLNFMHFILETQVRNTYIYR